MLGAPGDIEPISNTPNQRPNPLVSPPGVDLDALDTVAVTHLHCDPLDDAARDRLPAGIPVLCQPADVDNLEQTFTTVCPVSGVEELGPVTGFLFDADESVYVAGDTVWYGTVADTLATHTPDLAVVNTEEAQFLDGNPITMTRAGVVAFAETTDADVIAVHMEVINHCMLSREDLQTHLDDAGIENVTVPTDGAAVGR
jgi:L-ascorbate metabolism protein UlaG (beta-lactamase superfamily)